MSESRLQTSLRVVCKDLSESGAAYALVGGLAVSARTEPRFTKDLDLAVAAPTDAEAESFGWFPEIAAIPRGGRLPATSLHLRIIRPIESQDKCVPFCSITPSHSAYLLPPPKKWGRSGPLARQVNVKCVRRRH